MSEWDEKKFFEKACALRKELSDSDSELKDIELLQCPVSWAFHFYGIPLKHQ